MLLDERSSDVLPEWAFFVRAVVDSTGLSPTASRESLVDDAALEHVREQLGAGIRRWVLELGLTAPHLLTQFVAVHELGLKSLVRHDDDLARFITRWLTVDEICRMEGTFEGDREFYRNILPALASAAQTAEKGP